MRLFSRIACLVVAVAALVSVVSVSPASAHRGRTDSSGGHYCNVGSCAGTYHYHDTPLVSSDDSPGMCDKGAGSCLLGIAIGVSLMLGAPFFLPFWAFNKLSDRKLEKELEQERSERENMKKKVAELRAESKERAKKRKPVTRLGLLEKRLGVLREWFYDSDGNFQPHTGWQQLDSFEQASCRQWLPGIIADLKHRDSLGGLTEQEQQNLHDFLTWLEGEEWWRELTGQDDGLED